jgi:hypothetical protein
MIGWRKLPNEEGREFYSSCSIIRMSKSLMGWARITHRGEQEYRALVSTVMNLQVP